ncbi:hypothetical protein [Croceiramulus getboli]|nr:hypothetical protein P8624_04350 [Flavobacteriaceae bacterium YJPT1-3]
MKNYDQIEELWSAQPLDKGIPGDSADIQKKVETLSRKYTWTHLILGVTILGLVVFAVFVSGFSQRRSSLGFGLMIAALLLRGGIEAWHQYQLRNLDPGLPAVAYAQKLSRFYKSRTWVHYLLTPVCLGAYSWGFILLLPYFEASVSPGFYSYIWISALILLGIAIVFFWNLMQRELAEIKSMSAFDHKAEGQ